ncbi:MAG: hypothetical protein KKC46_14360 [Proteobacteria bacterium]|nr:hypothetical protein [Pseudomonadota bacterium]
MQINEKKYRRLPGKRRRIMGKDTLWAGSDHLLSIESSGVSENYKRFYYNDIKSITIAKTPKIYIITMILGLAIILITIFALYLLGAFSKTSSAFSLLAPVGIFFLLIDIVVLFYFIINIFYGTSRECWIETYTQREKLASVNRERVVNKFIETIKPLIEKEQGLLSIETLQNINHYSNIDIDKPLT